ncbi:MAG: hypothetical protein IJU84_04945 [Clostridia bacterium]|nr:hypothetical protein [Clostridia bacterium]
MVICKEEFINSFINIAIQHGETLDNAGIGMSEEEYSKVLSKRNKTAKLLENYSDFLSTDLDFARETLDLLIGNENIYVKFATTGLLWEYDYRIIDCYKLFEEIIANTDKAHGLLRLVAKTNYLAIKSGRLKKRKQFPKLQ